MSNTLMRSSVIDEMKSVTTVQVYSVYHSYEVNRIFYLLPLASCLLPLAYSLLPIPDSRFPIPDSRFPIPRSAVPLFFSLRRKFNQ
ncbi:hypothetical protein [Moorena producens]|uniref:hypothetical protein n=1 Tax=Moorena producens TaxID=1155739 RepID=UPI003C722563